VSIEPNKHLVVVYHEHCIDGLTSAWALHQKWGREPGTVITYVGYEHHKTEDAEKNILSAVTPDAELYFVDVAPRKALLNDLLSPDASGEKKLTSVHILDHHQTAANNLLHYKAPLIEGFQAPVLNLQLHDQYPSAAKMIWGMILPDQEVPAFLDVVDKMDRGTGLSTRKDFAAAALIDSWGVISLADTFNTCNELSKMTYDQMATEGMKILDDQKIRIEKLNDNVMYTKLEILPDSPPVLVPIVNADVQDFGRSITNYLQALGKKSGAGVAFAWHVEGNGSVTMSIRTVHFPSLQHFCEHIALQPPAAPPQIRIRKHRPD
jgi:hypothetical protein